MSVNSAFQALAHPVRRGIVALLKKHGELNAGEIAARFDLTKPTLTHHLNELVRAELLDRERRGQFIFYRINLSVIEDALHAAIELLSVVRPAPSKERGKS